MGHVMYFSASGREKSRHYFSCSSGPTVVSIKSMPVHVTLKLCFCIQWDRRVTYSILGHSGHEASMHSFHAWVSPVWPP
jgi:hypothetical protein